MLKKFLICILIVLILNNFFISNITYAATVWDAIGEGIEDILGTVVGLIASLFKPLALGLSYSAQMLMASVAYSQGTSDADGNITTGVVSLGDRMFLTPFDIIFNQVALVDVNIFNVPSQEGAIRNIRVAVAGWYYVMRNIAATILLCVLIYVGIRMAISTVASDKAAYKKMLIDWCVSLALIFLLQYIIVFTFGVNSAFIKALSETRDVTALDESTKNLFLSAVGIDLNSVAATVIICMLTWQTLSLLISYIQRMLKVSFLVIISPLITLTYSIDKMGDGKAQALNTWLKEFVYTVLLQPFHCIIYMVFVGMAINLMSGEIDDNSLAAMILVILCIHFTKEAEKLLGKIFNFNDSVSGNSLAAGMATTMLLTKNADKIGKGARSMVNGVKNFGGVVRTARVEMATLGGIMAGKGIAEARQAANDKVSSQDAKWDDAVDSAKKKVDSVKTKIMDKTGFTAAKGALEEAREKSKANSREKAIEKEMNKNGAGYALKMDANGKELETKEQYEERRKQAEDAVDKKLDAKKQRIQNLKNAKTFISQSKTAHMLTKQALPAMVSGGIATFVGAGKLGTGGNFIEAGSLAFGTYKGTQTYMATSSKNVSKNTAALIQGAGAQSDAQGREKMEDIMERSEEFENASEQIDRIFAEIKTALDDISDKDAETLKSRIKNVVDKQILEDPSANNDTILSAIENNKGIQGIVGSKMNDFKASDSLKEMIDFQRDSKIYENITTVNSWGLSTDAMMHETMKKFTPATTQETPNDTLPSGEQSGGEQQGGTNSPASNQEPQQGDNAEEEEINQETENIVNRIEDLPPEEIEKIKKALQEIQGNKKEYHRIIKIDEKDRDTAKEKYLEEKINELEQQVNELINKSKDDKIVISRLTASQDVLDDLIKRLHRNNGGTK